MKKKSITVSGLIFLGFFLSALDNRIKVQPVRTLDKKVSFRSVFAVNEDEAWVSGSRGSVYFINKSQNLFRKIKIPQTSNLDFRDIQGIGENIILVMSAGNGENSRLYRSSDQGKNWKLVYKNPYKKGFLNSFSFWNAKNGITVGDPLKGRLFILLTNDGGKTWQEAKKKSSPAAKAGEAGFAASGTCVVVYGDQLAWIGTGGSVARIFRTSDRGKTWRVFNTPLLSGQNSTGIFSVFFKSNTEGLIVGGDYKQEGAFIKTAAFTHDGGITWRLVKDGEVPFLSCVGEISSGDKECFIACGPAAVYYSLKGLKWEKISNKGYHCSSISRDKKSAWLAGSGGRIARIIIK